MAIKILTEQKTNVGLVLTNLILSLRGCYSVDKNHEGKVYARGNPALYADRSAQPLSYDELRCELKENEKPIEVLYNELKKRYPPVERMVQFEEEVQNADGSTSLVQREEMRTVPQCEDC